MIDPNKEAYLATAGVNDAISHLEEAVKVDEFVRAKDYYGDDIGAH